MGEQLASLHQAEHVLASTIKKEAHTASGSGMDINRIGHTTVQTRDQNIHLKNILHVPDASKSLISAHHLAKDNDVFIEIHPKFFCIKD